MDSLDGQPWYLQISAILTLAILVSTVTRVVIWPIFKRFWQAIVALPRMTDNVGRLVELLEIDILHKVEVLEIKEELTDKHLAEHSAKISGLVARVDALEMRINLVERKASELSSPG